MRISRPVTGHYRGAHAGGAAKSGFTCYLSIGYSVGGRGRTADGKPAGSSRS